MEVVSPAATLTLGMPLAGGSGVTKIGPGTLVLGNAANTFAGGVTVTAGRLDVGTESALGTGPLAAGPAGTIRYTNTASTARTFTLTGGTLEAPAGVALTLDGAAVYGGFLASAGTGKFVMTGNAAVNGATLFGGTTVDVTGPAAMTNVITGANATVAPGQTLTLTRGWQTSAGTLTVNGTVSAPQGWESAGVLRITGGTTPGQMTVGGSPLVLGGGSRTYVGANAAGQRGGTILLGGSTLELNGGLLVNNGDFIALNDGGIQNGVVNVNYGSLAKGTGYYEEVNVTDGGKFAPGNSITNTTSGTLTLNSGGTYEFEINRAARHPRRRRRRPAGRVGPAQPERRPEHQRDVRQPGDDPAGQPERGRHRPRHPAGLRPGPVLPVAGVPRQRRGGGERVLPGQVHARHDPVRQPGEPVRGRDVRPVPVRERRVRDVRPGPRAGGGAGGRGRGPGRVRPAATFARRSGTGRGSVRNEFDAVGVSRHRSNGPWRTEAVGSRGRPNEARGDGTVIEAKTGASGSARAGGVVVGHRPNHPGSPPPRRPPAAQDRRTPRPG